jgi:hypothetical protein
MGARELAKGTAILGNTPDAYNQVWNLPTDAEKITGEGWVNLFAQALNKPANYQMLPSSKFNERFNYVPMRNEEAVRQAVERLRVAHAQGRV